jgi:hypothetical protein
VISVGTTGADLESSRAMGRDGGGQASPARLSTRIQRQGERDPDRAVWNFAPFQPALLSLGQNAAVQSEYTALKTAT